MRKIYNILSIAMVTLFISGAIIGCSKDGGITKPKTPTDETQDRGHDLPDKVVFNVTDVASKTTQTIEAVNTSDGIKYNFTSPITFKKGRQYLFAIVYSNKSKRLNSEFVSAKMAPIHQHFFELYKGTYPKNRVERKEMVALMDNLVQYEYQDTDPEDKDLGEAGVTLRKRTWDTNNPTANDPIGLKGVFTIKEADDSTESFTLRIKLAHFLVANKLDPKSGEVRKYNVVEYTNAFVLDTNMELPIKLTK